MVIVSWNVNGLISWVDSQSYLPIIDLAPDVFCVQEIKTKRHISALDGYYHYWNPCERDGYHGTLTATREEPLQVIYGTGDEDLDAEGRVLTVELRTMFIVNCYAPRAVSLERREFRRRWDEALHVFAHKLLNRGKQVVLCGDFNVVRSELDVYPENDREHYAMKGILSDERGSLESFLASGFVDMYRYLCLGQDTCYTWWSARKNKRSDNRGWRLDYFFVSSFAVEQGCIKQMRHLTNIHGSDHAPILLELDVNFTDEEFAFEWEQTDWEEAEKALEYYQTRISFAARGKDLPYLLQLEHKMTHDLQIRKLAVRKVAQRTNTPGIDGVRWVTSADKMKAAKALNQGPYKAKPLRQIILVDKGSGKERHIGILSMYDRAMHTLYSFYLSPIMEYESEHRSFGFRIGRSAFDVNENIKDILTIPNPPEFVVRGDIKAFYASIQHSWLMKNIPMNKTILKEILGAGHVFAGEHHEDNSLGISEGSALSPVLSNMVLNGLQRYIWIELHEWDKIEKDLANGCMIRYVDDVLFTVRSESDGKRLLKILQKFLEERGLVLSPTKTYIVPIRTGFTFLSRRYWKERGILHVTPSDEAVSRFIGELEDIVSRGKRKSQRELIRHLNRTLKGWATYHRITEAEKAFHKVDAALQALLLKAACEKHPKQSQKKVIEKYWYRAKDGHHVYALPDDKSVRLIELKHTMLINYNPINAEKNPYLDASYFESRNHAKAIQHVTAPYRPIWTRQDGKCFFCARPILPDQPKTLVQIDNRRPASLQNSAYVHTMCQQNEIEYVGCMDDPYGLRPFDILNILEEVYRIGRNKKHHKIGYLKEKWRPGDTKWTHIMLKRYFAICIQPRITLSFQQIENIEGRKLHPSARIKASYWSESGKHYKSIADAWKSEGYKLAKLDLKNERVTWTLLRPEELLHVPDELMRQKLPDDAVFELEQHFEYIIKKYGLRMENE